MPRPHFTTGKDPVPILHEAGWAPWSFWTGGKSRPHRDFFPDRPAHSQSLYRLSYPAHTHTHTHIYIYIYAVANSVVFLLYLKNIFYNIVLEMNVGLYIASGSAPPCPGKNFWVPTVPCWTKSFLGSFWSLASPRGSTLFTKEERPIAVFTKVCKWAPA